MVSATLTWRVWLPSNRPNCPNTQHVQNGMHCEDQHLPCAEGDCLFPMWDDEGGARSIDTNNATHCCHAAKQFWKTHMEEIVCLSRSTMQEQHPCRLQIGHSRERPRRSWWNSTMSCRCARTYASVPPTQGCHVPLSGGVVTSPNQSLACGSTNLATRNKLSKSRGTTPARFHVCVFPR